MQPAYMHVPPPHDAIANGRPQSFPHVPHEVTVVRRFASQPLPADMSQSPKPASHETTRQPPIVHPPVAFAGAHSIPHPPQWETVVRMSISQPSIGSALQSP
jgi:hypothetical protein